MASHNRSRALGPMRPLMGASMRALGVAVSMMGLAWVGGVHAQTLKEAPKVASGGASAAIQSGVFIEGAWIRATVKGQTATGGFMDLTSDKPLTLIGFETPVARLAEVHEMVMDGDIMRMRAIESLPLPAKTKVSLKPGGHHLMLLDLKRPLPAGHTVQLTVSFKDESGRVIKQQVAVPVKALMPAHHH